MTAVWAVDTAHEPAFGTRYVMNTFRRPALGRGDEIFIDVDLQLAIRALDALIGGLPGSDIFFFLAQPLAPTGFYARSVLNVNVISDWKCSHSLKESGPAGSCRY